jgi:hypothetical protein
MRRQRTTYHHTFRSIDRLLKKKEQMSSKKILFKIITNRRRNKSLYFDNKLSIVRQHSTRSRRYDNSQIVTNCRAILIRLRIANSPKFKSFKNTKY